MLNFGALLKYDLKALARVLVPIYGGTLVVAIVTAIFFSTVSGNDKFMDNFGWFVGPLPAWIGTFAVATIIVTGIVYIIQRFMKNLLGSEGYLSMTLPVSINAHISSKAIAATIWMAIAIIVSFIVGAILYLTPADILYESKLIFATEVEPGYRLSFVLTSLEVFALGLIGIMEAILKIYAAISIGQRWSNHKHAGAGLAYIGIVIIEGIAALIFNKIIPDTFFRFEGLSELAEFQVGIALIALLGVVLGAIYWTVTRIMLSKHLNLD